MALAAAPLGPRDEWANPALVAPKAALCWRRLIAGCSAALCLRVPGADLPFMGPLSRAACTVGGACLQRNNRPAGCRVSHCHYPPFFAAMAQSG